MRPMPERQRGKANPTWSMRCCLRSEGSAPPHETIGRRKSPWTNSEACSAFRQRADELGEGFLEAVLHDAIYGLPEQQDSRYFSRSRARNRAGSGPDV